MPNLKKVCYSVLINVKIFFFFFKRIPNYFNNINIGGCKTILGYESFQEASQNSVDQKKIYLVKPDLVLLANS